MVQIGAMVAILLTRSTLVYPELRLPSDQRHWLGMGAAAGARARPRAPALELGVLGHRALVVEADADLLPARDDERRACMSEVAVLRRLDERGPPPASMDERRNELRPELRPADTRPVPVPCGCSRITSRSAARRSRS